MVLWALKNSMGGEIFIPKYLVINHRFVEAVVNLVKK